MKVAYPDVILREAVFDSEVLDPGGEPLVEPEVGPPVHGNEVAEPHVRHLVRDHKSHASFRLQRRLRVVNQESRFSTTNSRAKLQRKRCMAPFLMHGGVRGGGLQGRRGVSGGVGGKTELAEEE